MIPCTHPGPCKQLVATGKRGPAFEPCSCDEVLALRSQLVAAERLLDEAASFVEIASNLGVVSVKGRNNAIGWLAKLDARRGR